MHSFSLSANLPRLKSLWPYNIAFPSNNEVSGKGLDTVTLRSLSLDPQFGALSKFTPASDPTQKNFDNFQHLSESLPFGSPPLSPASFATTSSLCDCQNVSSRLISDQHEGWIKRPRNRTVCPFRKVHSLEDDAFCSIMILVRRR